MRMTFWLLFGAVLAAGNLPAATIQFQVNNLGSNSFQYNYFVSGITLQANQEVDIRFDPTSYAVLSNPVVGSNFQAMVLQPNNPPGTFGDYSAFTMINNPSLAGPFSVNFTLTATGSAGPQPFFINQYDANGNKISVRDFGFTTPVSTGVPEPGSLALCGLTLLFSIVVAASRIGLRGRFNHDRLGLKD